MLLGPKAVITEEKQLLCISRASLQNHGTILFSHRIDFFLINFPRSSELHRTGFWGAGVPGAWTGLLQRPGGLDGGRDFFQGEEADLAFLTLPTLFTSFLELAARAPRTLHDLLESGDLFLSYSLFERTETDCWAGGMAWEAYG